MGTTRKYTINLSEHVVFGSKCSKPVIIWDDPVQGCSSIRCVKNNGWEVRVSVQEGCDETCFWGSYVCEDSNCKDCPQEPIRLRICVCQGPGDCDGCSDCVGNLCVSRCDPDQFCNDADICVDCDEDHPCLNGKQCVGGKCVCPPTKPYLDSNGDCAPCNATSCPPGQICTPRGCEPPVCDEGVWHPVLLRCVECLNSGNCGPNEVCNPETNECECRDGFVKDVNGNCVQGPECVVDSDCNSPCLYCDHGQCRDVECPDGKICIPEEDGCVEICDCDNPGCSNPNAACVRQLGDICYCKVCSGSCANGEACGDGCYCDPVDLTCKPYPCPDPPCDGPDPCDGPCDRFGGCPEGCYCDGSRCRSCDRLSCEECAQHPECKCVSGNCEGNPDFCKDVFNATSFSCGVDAELRLENGCMCPAVTAYTIPWYLSKQLGGNNTNRYEIGLSVRLAKGAGQGWGQIQNLHVLDETQYEDIADNDTPLSGSVTVTVKEFYQPQIWGNGGWVSSGSVVAETLPVSKTISFSGIARKEDLQLQFSVYRIGSGRDVIPGQSQKKIIKYEVEIKTGSFSFANNCLYSGKTLPVLKLDSGAFKTVTNELDAGSALAFRDFIIHPGVPTGNYDMGGKFMKSVALTSPSKRKPLFTWYRSEDDTYTAADIIRKLYISEDSAKTYKDSLFGPETFSATKQNLISPEGRVFGNMYYRVTNDCACSDRDKDLGLLKWCDPAGMSLSNIVFSQCNKKVDINSDIARPCVTNWDLNEFDLHANDSSTVFKTRHQARYVLVIETENGGFFETGYKWRETGVPTPGLYSVVGGVSIKDYSQTFAAAITAMRLELRYGLGEIVCVWEKQIPPASNFTPTYQKICEPGDTNIKYRFNLASNHITNIIAVGGSVVNGAGYKDVVAAQGAAVTAHFSFSDYCPTTMTLSETCCDSLNIGFSVNETSTTTELTATVSGGTLPYEVRYFRTLGSGAEFVGDSVSAAQNFKVILVDPVPGLYFAEVIDGSGTCTKSTAPISIDPRNPDDYFLTIVPTMTGCTYTGTVAVSIPNQPDIVGSKIYYKVNGGAEQFFTVTAGMAATGENLLPATGSTVELTKISVPNQAGPDTVFPQSGSATVPANLTGSVPAVTGFTINGSTSSTNICAGDTALIEIAGTPNSIVGFDNIASIYLNGAGHGSANVSPGTNTTYTITSVTSADGQCTGMQGVGTARSVQVTAAPTIVVTNESCDGSQTLKTVTFSNLTSATDQFGTPLSISGTSVTVPVATVTVINAVYTVGLCSVTYNHPVGACAAPTITGTVSGPDSVCAGDPALITVSGISGGTAPYSYNYYTDSDYNEIYVPGQTSKSFGFSVTTTVYVRVKDAFGNMSPIGQKTVFVAALPVPEIVPVSGIGVGEDSGGGYEISDSLAEVVFKTAISYSLYAWEVTGTYGGTSTGSGATFSIDPALIAGTVQLKVTVTNGSGCTASETVDLTVVTAPAILGSDELLLTTAEYKLYKVQVTPSSVGVPVLVCGAGNPAASLAMTGTGQLISAAGNYLYSIDVFGGCGNTQIGLLSHTNSLGMLTGSRVVSMLAPDILTSYDLNTNTNEGLIYTISDGANHYYPTGDIVRVSNTLYALAQQQPSGNYVLIEFSIDGGDNITGFAVTGVLPAQSAGVLPYGLAYVGTTLYLVYSTGKVYNVNTSNVPASAHIGTIVVPMAIPIWDVTNNF